MNGIKEMLKDLVDATYRESSNTKEALIEDFAVNLNPFLRPAHFFKARDAMAKGDDIGALAHTIQANPFLPALPTGLIDVLRKEGKIPEPPELSEIF